MAISFDSIPLSMKQSFNKAVSLGENLQLDGSVNWNWVDADVYMDMHPTGDGNDTNRDHYIMFDMLCDAYEQANGIQVQSSAICDDVASLGQ